MGPYGLGFPQEHVVDHGWKLYITSLVMIISAGLVVIARLATRYHLNRFGWDDLTVVASLLFSIMVSVCMQLAIEYGYGVHQDDLSIPNLSKALKLFFLAQTPYKVSVCLNKVTAILLFLRIFVTKNFRIACYAVLGVVVSWSVATIFATIFQCVPIEGAWNPTIDAVCIDTSKFWVAYAIGNILTDVMVLALPIQPILNIQLRLRERLLLCGVFLMGGFVTVASILRTTVVSNSVQNKSDITYNFIARGMWTLIECNLGIISACLPVLKKPLGKIFPRVFGSVTGRSGYGDIQGDKENSKGYKLSDFSARQTPNQTFWIDTNKSNFTVTTTPVAHEHRASDERHIVTNSSGRSHSDLEG